MNYSESGVNIDLGNKVKSELKTRITATRPEVLGKIGGFGGLFNFQAQDYKDPVLVSSTDGVGSKLKLAFEYGYHQTVAEDLVNHCVNDIMVTGAKPLFFLDYIGMNKLNEEVFNQLIEGFNKACAENDCALIGGETAQLPDLYAENEYDLSGTIVGAVDKNNIIDGSSIVDGDIIIGFSSVGLHTNGYTLARKVLKDNMDEQTVKELMMPHISYYHIINHITKYFAPKAFAHITGGGIADNMKRTLKNNRAVINKSKIVVPNIFRKIQEIGQISEEEMFRVFNMGIGLTVVIDKLFAQEIVDEINYSHVRHSKGSKAYIIGQIQNTDSQVTLV
jgi:phosphoribosylformylglycinamidine cyclo-ligase